VLYFTLVIVEPKEPFDYKATGLTGHCHKPTYFTVDSGYSSSSVLKNLTKKRIEGLSSIAKLTTFKTLKANDLDDIKCANVHAMLVVVCLGSVDMVLKRSHSEYESVT